MRSSPSVLSPYVNVRQTLGLTKNVFRQSVKFDGLSGLLAPVALLKPRLPELQNAASTAPSYDGNVNRSGRQRSTLRSHHHVSCGTRSTLCYAAVVSLPPTTSVLTSLIESLTTRSLVSDRLQLTLHRCCFSQLYPPHRF